MQYTLPEIEPLVTWDDVENHPDYQGLPPDKQMNVKKGWFKKTVESSDEWESKDVFKQNLARQNFFLPNTIPTPQKEALVKKYPEQWAAFMVGGGAAKLPGAAIKGARAIPAFLKGAGETALTLGMMDKGYEAGHEAVGMVTDNEYAKMVGGAVVAGMLPVGAYYSLRYAVNRHSWPEAEPQPNVGANKNKWKAAYSIELEKVKRILGTPWKGTAKPGAKVKPKEPSWDDLMKKYGTAENLFKENGGMANTARKYKSAYDWMSNQRSKGDTSYQAEAEYRNGKAKAREDATKADSEYWENLKRQNKESWDKIKKAADARRASGESKPQDKDYALTVVEDNLPVSTAREVALSSRKGIPLLPPPPVEEVKTPPTIEVKEKGIPKVIEQGKEVVELGKKEVLPKGEKVDVEPKVTETPEGEKVSVPMPEKKADALSLKEQKSYLIDEIDKAIETAPEDGGKDKVTIEVPGDGTFTLLHDKEALTRLKKQAKSYPTDAKQKKTIKPGTEPLKPTGKRMIGEKGGREELEYYNEFRPRKQNIIEEGKIGGYQYYKEGFFGTGTYAVKMAEKPKTKKLTLTGKEAPDLENIIPKGELKRAEIVGEFYTYKNKDPVPTAHIKVEDGSDVYIQAKYADVILTKYPNAEVEVERNGLVIFKDKNEIVGMVGPFMRDSVTLPEDFERPLKEKQAKADTTLEFMGMQQIWDGIKDIFTETKPDAGPSNSIIRPIADQVKLLFKKYYGLNPEMEKRFTEIEDSKEIIEHEVLDQIFNKGLPHLTKKEAIQLTWHRSDPTKYPLPEGRGREAEFVNQTLEYAIEAQTRRGLSARWPDTVIARVESKIDTLEQEIETMRSKAAVEKRRALINDLKQTLEELKKRRYVPHIAVPTFTKKILGMIESVVPGGWRPRSGEKLSSQVKRFLGRQTLSLEEFVEACNKKKIEPELDIRVLLSDYLNYTIDKCNIYDEVEKLKKIPDLVLPVDQMPSDWKEIKGNKQLQGYGAHPFMVEAIKEFTSEYPDRNILMKAYDSVNRIGKFIVFYNPMIMTMNDMSQIFMGGSLLSKEMGKTALGFVKPDMDSAVHDVIARSTLMKESQKLGLFSTPWRGGPNMIETAQMWADHLETTKPEWHKNLEKALGRIVSPKDWLNPIISGKDFYDTAFKVTWTLDRIWRMTQVRNFMRKGMSLPQAVKRTRMLMVQYNYLPNKTRVGLNRIFLTPTYRTGMMRLYGNLFKHPAGKIPLPYKGMSKEQIPWEKRTEEGSTKEYSQENMKTLGRWALLKFLMYVGAPLFGWQWLESYRMIKRKESGEEEVFTLPGPIFELEKYMGRALTNTLYLNLARIPYMIASLSKNRDWKGEKIVQKGAPSHIIGGKIAWYITKTYLAPLERFELLAGDEQDAMGKALSFLAVSKYTRQSPYAWQAYQIYRANREYIEYINPRNSAGIIDVKNRPSPENMVRANTKLRNRMKEINEGFVERQQKLREPYKENLFWKIFLEPQQEM